MVDVVAGLAAMAQAIDIVKSIREMDKSLDDAQVKLRMAELYSALTDAKMALADAKMDLQAKDAEIARLKEVVADRVPTIRIGEFNFGVGLTGEVYRWAFCNTCEQTSGLQIIVAPGPGGRNICPKCKGVYDGRATSKPAGFKLPDGSQSSTS